MYICSYINPNKAGLFEGSFSWGGEGGVWVEDRRYNFQKATGGGDQTARPPTPSRFRVKVQHISLVNRHTCSYLASGIVSRGHMCYISSIFLYFHWDFHNRHYFYDKGTLIVFFQIKSFCKIIFGSVTDNTSVELENRKHWQSLMLYFLFFLYSSVFFS